MLNTSVLLVSIATEDITASQNQLQTQGLNISLPDDCAVVNFSAMPYLPWDNPDNIISAETEAVIGRIGNVLLVFLFLIGGPGNLLNMLVFYKQSLRDRVNLCLFALALADEVYHVSTIFQCADQVYLQFTSKKGLGPVYTFIVDNFLLGTGGFFFVSNILSAVIATERCLCVLNPLKFQTLMHTRTMASIIIVVYVVVMGMFFIIALPYRVRCVYDLQSGAMMNTPVRTDFYGDSKKLVDFLDGVIFGAGLPVGTITVVIITTSITVVKLGQVVTWRAETSSSSLSAREVALTKMLVFNSALFVVCLFPVAVTRCAWIFLPEIRSGGRHHNLFLTTVWILEIFASINSSFNIFVFYAMGSRYRKTLWELFGKNVDPEKDTGTVELSKKEQLSK